MGRKRGANLDPSLLTEGSWDAIERDYELDPQYSMLVVVGRQAWARWVELRKLLDKTGVMVEGRFGARLNPLVGAEARAREGLVKILAQLSFAEEGD
jgi:hypothetical protein